MLLRLGGLGLYSIIVIDDPPLQLLFVHLCLKEISMGSLTEKRIGSSSI